MKPVCVRCQRFYRVKKNGYAFVEGMPLEKNARPGLVDDRKWGPYKLWNGDLWECHGCGSQIVVGVVGDRLAEHYEPDFLQKVEAFEAVMKVNDC